MKDLGIKFHRINECHKNTVRYISIPVLKRRTNFRRKRNIFENSKAKKEEALVTNPSCHLTYLYRKEHPCSLVGTTD